MSSKPFVVAVCVATCVVLVSAHAATRAVATPNATVSQTRPAPQTPAEPASEVQAPTGARRDPTQSDAVLDRALSGGETSGGATGESRVFTRAQVPPLVLRALVVAKGKPGTALVEHAGVLHRVAENDVMSLSIDRTRRVELRVVSLTRDEVRFECAELGQVVTLR